MKIKNILGINEAKLLFGNIDTVLDNFTIDTRKIKEGDTFLGIKGENVDGNLYWEEAFLKGAKTCIVSNIDIPASMKEKYLDKNLILVADSIPFLTEIAKLKRKTINVPIIAVTGSVGKTSTKNIIAEVLSAKYKVFKTKGNFNSVIGMSLTMLSIHDEEIVVLEMGMNQKGEISCLTNIAQPDVAVITNIGTSHIGNLGSRENILKAKLEILEGLKGPIIINNDNDLLNAWQKEAQINNPIITYGIDTNSMYQACDLSYSASGSTFKINDYTININVIGKHFVYNSLVAYILGTMYDVDKEQIKEKLKHLELEPNRMELINKNNITIINDTYNSSYESLYYALEVLSSFTGRKIAVLGDILELGEYAEEMHRKIANLILKNSIDILVTVGPLSKYINEEAINLGFKGENIHFNTNEEAIIYLLKIKKEKDNILVKASNAMHFIEIVERLRNE